MEVVLNGFFFKMMARICLLNILIFNTTAQAEDTNNVQCDQEFLSKGWGVLADNKIFFGHQSVGNNILDGLELLAAKCNKKFTLIQTRDADQVNGSVFAHAQIGKNKHPETKLADFKMLMEQGMGQKVDIAFMKLCYVDFQHDTKVDELFVKYGEMLAALGERHPNTKYFAVSVPLTTIQTGPKAWIKKIIGRPVSGIIENKKRQEFNKLLRAEYGANDRLFDIAVIESTLPDGTREKYQLDGQEYYSLYQGYTDDGEHLNEVGQLRAAQALLDVIGKM
ncbi:MAG: hypothetical protein WBM99_14335 [Psychromonas sp.]